MNQYIRMISEGSCYTEDWSNDAEIQLTYYLQLTVFLIK